MQPIIVEIGEFFENPIRTGIQRTVRELIRNWPSSVPVRYARYEPTSNTLVSISLKALRFAVESTLPWEEVAREALQLDRFGHSRPIVPSATDRVLVPELFYRPDRVNFYANALLQKKFLAYFIVFDFVPWLNPEALRVAPEVANTIMYYLTLLPNVNHLAFISESVRQDFFYRITRKLDRVAGPVIALGADALGLEKQYYSADHRDYVCVGTLDGKKRQDIVFNAFRKLPPPNDGGKLRFFGNVPLEPARYMTELLNYRGTDVEVIRTSSDDMLREAFRRARATVFTSTDEGYGLPAVESLYSGIPVVTHANLPALADVRSLGQIRLSDISVNSVAEALNDLRDEAKIKELWREAALISLPSWADYSRSVSEWVSCTPLSKQSLS